MNFESKLLRKKAAHEWVDYLRESDGLAGILAKTEDLARLRSILGLALTKVGLDHLLPKIEAGWRSGGQNELFLLVSSSSIASRLQQTLPSLINELQALDIKCSAIKVRVKPTPPSWDIKPRIQNQKIQKPPGFNEVAKKSWKELLNKLSPDSELYKTVQKLLQNK